MASKKFLIGFVSPFAIIFVLALTLFFHFALKIVTV